MTGAKITADQAGCWLGGHGGWTNSYRVIYLAESYGFTLTEEDQDAVVKYRAHHGVTEDELIEAVIGQGGLVDKATAYLESLVPEGYHFEWDAGELSLLPCSEIEGDSCDAG